MPTLLKFVFRVLFVLAGLVIAASLAALLALGVTAWALRAGWARLTGRRAAPFVVRFGPRQGFDRWAGRWPSTAGGGPVPVRSHRLQDVTDVEVKPR